MNHCLFKAKDTKGAVGNTVDYSSLTKHQREEDFKRNMESNFSQQETQVRDAAGNRWIKCEFCGKIAMESEFNTYGGAGHINLTCCAR